MWRKNFKKQYAEDDYYEDEDRGIPDSARCVTKKEIQEEAMTPFFGEELYCRGKVEGGQEQVSRPERQQEFEECEQQVSIEIEEILKKYEGCQEKIPSEHEFNMVCSYLGIDDPESYDEVLTTYLSHILSNVKKLHSKIDKQLRDLEEKKMTILNAVAKSDAQIDLIMSQIC
ncbi:unnamed protein product [Moneuplotes crassus]|uniref:Uncharacterized protein n=1 Tax=Euplotes crassus TaxID=5936 RepID=A0AAD2D498_EUPCR|nr:unnamed protein product [Moneuplotes crassus]